MKKLFCTIVLLLALLGVAAGEPYNPVKISDAGCFGITVVSKNEDIELYRAIVWLDGYPTPYEMWPAGDSLTIQDQVFIMLDAPSVHRVDWVWVYTDIPFDIFGLGPLEFTCEKGEIVQVFVPLIVR